MNSWASNQSDGFDNQGTEIAMTINNTRIKPFIVAAAGIAALLTIVNLAPAGEPRPRYRTAPAVDETRIEVDQAANAIRFYVRGEQVALIDSQGLNG
jgi:hypothetical protein